VTGFADNSRLFLAPTSFKSFAVTREIMTGCCAPRFAPSQRGWVLSYAKEVKSGLAGIHRRDGWTNR